MQSFFTPGTISAITGSPGTGKSNLAMVLGEIALQKRPDYEILSNILLKKKNYERYRYFKLQSHFLWHLTAIKGGVFIPDEAGTYATSGAGDRKNIRGQLEAMAKLCRKFQLSILWIDQRWDKSVPPAIREMSSYRFHTPEKGKVEVYRVHEGECVFLEEWDNDTLTSIPYDHLSMATFQTDLPDKLTMFNVFDDIADTPSNQIQPELRKWLLLHGVAPPKLAEFESFYSEERNIEGSGEKDDNITSEKRGRFDGLTPEEEIPLRAGVYCALQHNKYVRMADLEKVFGRSRQAIKRYRDEFRGRLKVRS